MGIEKINFNDDYIVEEGIYNFVHNRFAFAKSYFTLSLARNLNNRIAKFGLICIDAIDDGFFEAADIFKIFLFLPDDKQNNILEAFTANNHPDIIDFPNLVSMILSEEYNRSFEFQDFIDDSFFEDDSFKSFMILGKIYRKMNDIDKAIEQFLKAYQIKPFDNKVMHELIKTIKKKNG